MARGKKIPRFRKRRVSRIRTELGLWLAQKHGGSTRYEKMQIDRGREELGFSGVDDALVAYTFFGANFVPEYLALNGLEEFAVEIETVLDSMADDIGASVFEDGAI